jgi:hypothetical protein
VLGNERRTRTHPVTGRHPHPEQNRQSLSSSATAADVIWRDIQRSVVHTGGVDVYWIEVRWDDQVSVEDRRLAGQLLGEPVVAQASWDTRQPPPPVGYKPNPQPPRLILLLNHGAQEHDAEEIAARLRAVPRVTSARVQRSEGHWGSDGRLRDTAPPRPQVQQLTAPSGRTQSFEQLPVPPPTPGFSSWEGPPAAGLVKLGRADKGRRIEVEVGTTIEIDLTPGYIEGPSWPAHLFPVEIRHEIGGLAQAKLKAQGAPSATIIRGRLAARTRTGVNSGWQVEIVIHSNSA